MLQVMSNKRLAHTNQALAESNHQLGETTRTLEKEKLASDELVKRQLKLIACLEVPSDGAGLNGSFVNDVDGGYVSDNRAGMALVVSDTTQLLVDLVTMLQAVTFALP